MIGTDDGKLIKALVGIRESNKKIFFENFITG
jgi:hypothetical protein